MFHLLLVPVVLSATLAADDSRHVFTTGNDLVRLCESKDAKDIAECRGYVKGAADALEYFRSVRHMGRCLPEGQKVEALVSLTLQRLKLVPNERALGAEESLLSVIDQYCEPEFYH
jgi:Rap1a immunity proteins